jgi:O-antigen/teichoic acid export membrane protein
MQSRATVIFFNTLTSYGRMAVGFFVGLGITRLTFRVLADRPEQAKVIFGTYALLVAAIGFTIFVNESLQQAMSRFLAISTHAKEWDEVRRLFSTGWLMTTLIGLAISVTIIAVAPWVLGQFNIPPSLLGEARTAVLIAAAAQALNSSLQTWQAALAAQERYTALNAAALLTQFLVLGGVGALAWLPVPRLIGLTVAMLAPTVLVAGVLAAWVAATQPIFRPRRQYLRRQECRALSGMTGWSTVATFACSFYERADQIIINIFLGPVFNAPYSVTAQFQGYVVRLVGAFTGVLLPSASKIASQDAVSEKQQFLVRATRYGLAIALPMVLLGIAFRREIVETWLGAGFEEAIRIFPVAMLIIFVQCIAGAASIYVAAANRLKWPAIAALADGVVNVFLSIFFVKVLGWGLNGVLLGSLVTTTLSRGVFFTAYAAHLVGMPIIQFWRQSLAAIALAGLWLVPCVLLVERAHLGLPLTGFALSVVGCGYVAWIWYVLFDGFERGLVGSLLTRLVRRPAAPVG